MLFDQVTWTVVGSSGAVPTVVVTETSWALTASGAETSTATLAEKSPTVPSTAKLPSSR